jgi:phosphate transport system permease protein
VNHATIRLFARTQDGKRAYAQQSIAHAIFLSMTVMLIIPLVLILGLLVLRGAPAISTTFLFTAPSNGMTAGGIFPALVGTLWLVGVSLAIAAPVGVLAAIYLNEYAPDNWLTRIIHLAIVNLAGVPSIVHALFGLGAFVLFLNLGTSILAASLTLGIMTLPVIIASTREALAAVPMAFREACWNVGATRWQTIRHVVLPNSISGILTGVILQVSRAAGETAPIIFTGAAFYLPYLPHSVRDQCMALSMHLFVISTQVPNVPKAMPYATALVLVGVVLVVNSASIALRSRLRSQRKW